MPRCCDVWRWRRGEPACSLARAERAGGGEDRVDPAACAVLVSCEPLVWVPGVCSGLCRGFCLLRDLRSAAASFSAAWRPATAVRRRSLLEG